MIHRLIFSALLFTVSIHISDAQQISKNGSRYEYDHTIYTSYEIGSILENDSEAKTYYDTFRFKIRKGRNVALFGGGLIIGSITYIHVYEKPTTGGTLSDVEDSLILGIGVILTGTITSLVGLITIANGYTNLSKSIRVYNDNHPKSKELGHTLQIGMTNAGIGIAYRF